MKYLRYDKITWKAQALSPNELKEIKQFAVLKISDKKYTELKKKELKQINIVNWKDIKIISDADYKNMLEIRKRSDILENNRKTIEKYILQKYPYYKQINNIYNLLLALKPIIDWLDVPNDQKIALDATYTMINDIFADITEYKTKQADILEYNPYKEDEE